MATRPQKQMREFTLRRALGGVWNDRVREKSQNSVCLRWIKGGFFLVYFGHITDLFSECWIELKTHNKPFKSTFKIHRRNQKVFKRKPRNVFRVYTESVRQTLPIDQIPVGLCTGRLPQPKLLGDVGKWNWNLCLYSVFMKIVRPKSKFSEIDRKWSNFNSN